MEKTSMNDLITYLSAIGSFLWGIIKGIFNFILMIPTGILGKFPFKEYFLVYIFTLVPIIVWLLMKIPAVMNFMIKHQSWFFITKKFDFGIISSEFVHKNGLHLLGNILIMIPVSIWCSYLMNNTSYLDWKKLSVIIQINMVAKWLVVLIRSHSKWSDGHDISTGMSGEIYCMLFTALAVCMKSVDNDLITAIIFMFFGIVVIISLATEFSKNSKIDGGVHVVSILNGFILGSILPII